MRAVPVGRLASSVGQVSISGTTSDAAGISAQSDVRPLTLRSRSPVVHHLVEGCVETSRVAAPPDTSPMARIRHAQLARRTAGLENRRKPCGERGERGSRPRVQGRRLLQAP